LRGIDWSFDKRGRAPAIEGIHPYPAKFIGDIPRALIASLQIPRGSVILDPFCGSGTTLTEAQRAGVEAIGIDLNPIACLIARVKTQPLPHGFDLAVRRVVAAARSHPALPAPNIPNVEHWFPPQIQQAVGAIAQTIVAPDFHLWTDQLRLVLSSILVRVSNQDSDTRYAAVTKSVSFEDVLDAFSLAASKLNRALSDRTWSLSGARVIEANTLEVTAAEIGAPVGLVVTSPPYPNAYEYWLYHKYRMWWLGFDPIAVREKEIGARAHFFKKNPHTANHFVTQMDHTFELLSSVLVPRGFVCFVVGRSKIHGELVDNGTIIEAVGLQHGLSLLSRVERVISSTRKSFNLSHARIKTESILTFQKT
jgi:site-specific DNA-methyltransferase (cytosine-N4-specific)